MNDYTFALMPESEFSRELEELRMRLIGNSLVDSFPPHLTLKRRFTLSRQYSTADLLNVLNNLSLPKITATKNKIARLGEVMVVLIENFNLKMYNKSLTKLLADTVVNKSQEFEGDNFISHLTLVRDQKKKFKESDYSELKVNEILFDRICLYEIDPTPERRFANQIACKRLL